MHTYNLSITNTYQKEELTGMAIIAKTDSCLSNREKAAWLFEMTRLKKFKMVTKNQH